MQAFVRQSDRAGDTHVREVDPPTPGPGEVLVRVAACGLCGSDIHAVHADPGFEFVKVPVVLGHELSGSVEQVGPGVDDLPPGTGVVVVSIQGCGSCPTCLAGDTQLCTDRHIHGLHHDGGLAELTVVARRHLVRVPAGLDLRTAALAEPLSVAVHATLDRAAIRPGTRVVVTGPGPIGLFCARLALLSGGDVLLLGTSADAEQRLPLGARFGVRTDVLAPDRTAGDAISAVWGPRAPDAWIEASGSVAALSAAVEQVRPGGEITVVALFARPLSLVVTDAVRRELSIRFSYASRYPEYLVALDLLASGAVDGAAVVTTFPLARAAEALAAAEQQRVVKPLVLPGPDQPASARPAPGESATAQPAKVGSGSPGTSTATVNR